jgi:hypothetical protein
MNSFMPCTDAHPALGEEVTVMGDVDVNVGKSVNSTSDAKERMSKDE